jgi:hypothetical protein
MKRNCLIWLDPNCKIIANKEKAKMKNEIKWNASFSQIDITELIFPWK